MNHLSVASKPTSLVAGTSTTITFTAYDQFNNPVTSYHDSVSLSDVLGGGSFGGVTFSNGVGAVSASLYKAGSDSVVVNDCSLTSSQQRSDHGLCLVGHALHGQHFSRQQQHGRRHDDRERHRGRCLRQPGPELQRQCDAQRFGRRRSFSAVTFDTPGVGTATAVLDTAGSQTITAQDTTVASTNGSVGFSVTAGAATHLLVSASPASITAGGTETVSITAQDSFGNTATGDGDLVTLSDSLGGTAPVTATLASGLGSLP